jgi:hypothetical protein
MTQKNPINTNDLSEAARKSSDKESYQIQHKTHLYRIGVGARITPPDASFYIEVILNLSDESKKVDLNKLDNFLKLLRVLQTRKYSLTYEDDNCIQCETIRTSQDLNEEYVFLTSLLESQLY